MKIRVRELAFGILLVALPCAVYADIGQLVGKWKNVDPETRGLAILEIDVTGNQVMVHAWGTCHPTACDWGSVRATAFAPNVGSRLPDQARTLLALFNSGFNEKMVVIDVVAGDKLRVEALTRFTDNSRRTAYSAVDTLSRQADANK